MINTNLSIEDNAIIILQKRIESRLFYFVARAAINPSDKKIKAKIEKLSLYLNEIKQGRISPGLKDKWDITFGECALVLKKYEAVKSIFNKIVEYQVQLFEVPMQQDLAFSESIDRIKIDFNMQSLLVDFESLNIYSLYIGLISNSTVIYCDVINAINELRENIQKGVEDWKIKTLQLKVELELQNWKDKFKAHL